MFVGEPEVTAYQSIGVFGFLKVGIHAVGIEVQRIHMIDRELSMNSRRIFTHREIYTGL